MSLNGLDAANVAEAYQSAVTDPGGWFLLKYVSRDGVELLSRGRGGVHEARTTISKYLDNSPLYGLLMYRRRKVLIKYIPEGTSRVLQARTAVHFQDIVERYQPYETLLEITTAEGLNDTSLAAAFPLHTALSSANASRLHEISEDAEDTGTLPKQPPKQSNNGSIFGTRQYKMERRVEQVMRPTPALNARSIVAEATAKVPLASQILVREDSGKRSITSVSSPLSESFTEYTAPSTAPSESSTREATSKSSLVDTPRSQKSSTAPEVSKPEPRAQIPIQRPERQSSLSPTREVPQAIPQIKTVAEEPAPVKQESPSEQLSHADRMKKVEEEVFDFSYLEPKQKVRLAPRPVAANAQAKRSTASGTSALPAHYRPLAKKPDLLTSTSLYGSSPHLPVVPVPPIPDAPEYNPRPISRGSVRSLTSQKNSAMTPEKIRLMKAVELRKRQLRKSNSSLAPPVVDSSSESSAVAPEVPQLPERIVEQPKSEALAEELHQRVINEEAATKKADSGIEMDYEKTQPKLAVEEEKVSPVEPSEEAPSEEDPTTAEALRNDELKAEAEGYGAVPAEEPDDAQPRLVRKQSPVPDIASRELSPSSNYSDAKTEQPSLAAAQAATQALEQSQSRDTITAEDDLPTPTAAPEIVMSPSSPSDIAHGQRSSTTAGAEETDDTDSQSTLEVQQSPRRQNSDLAKRRRGLVEPLALENTKDILAQDDELMDELQSADVEEGQAATAVKSPAAALFARRPSNQSFTSATSQPSEYSVPSHTNTGTNTREASPGPAGSSTQKRPVSPVESTTPDSYAGIKRNVSSGIAKRFQALSETSSQDSLQDRKLRSPLRTRTSSFRTRWGMGDRTSSTSTVDSAPAWSVSQDNSGSRDSINVRARIVRPPSGLVSHAEKPDVEEPAQLQQSKIEISHSTKAPIPSALPTISTAVPPPEVRSPTRAFQQAFTPQTAVPEDFPAPPTNTARPVVTPVNDDASTIGSKTDSRTSRFFKRMSSLGGSKRRSTAPQPSTIVQSPTATPTSAPSTASARSVRTPSTITEQDRSDMPPAAALGDLNVQFPDTLLWKRRWVTLDDAGNLVLVVSQVKEQKRGANQKKYALGEFKLPAIPDMDRLEMPHSVCLELLEGGTLQIACEDAMGQRQVLSMLRSYWKSWVG